MLSFIMLNVIMLGVVMLNPETRMEMADSDKHSSLFPYIINDDNRVVSGLACKY
jgi:hypothetical protein